MPEEKVEFIPLFNERSTYLITGGLGGVGLQVCKYMVEQGAKYIILVGRNGPSEKAKSVLESLKDGCNFKVILGDVGNIQDCERIFGEVNSLNFPTIRGVMHAAGTLSDGLFQNLTWSDFEKTFRAKVEGSWNLHNFTKVLPLEHFVLFSSIAASMSMPGQTTHVSACTFEDGMARYRLSQGLPATTINWGQFGQAGVVGEADLEYLRPFSIQQGLNALDNILRYNRNGITVANFEGNFQARVKSVPYLKAFVDEKMISGRVEEDKGVQKLNNSLFSSELEKAEGEGKKLKIIQEYLQLSLASVLRAGDERVDENADFQEIGIDSLMMLEWANLIQLVVGEKVAVNQATVRNSPNIKELGKALLTELKN